jgi:hypothetical protein
MKTPINSTETTSQTHDEFLASLRDAHANGRPLAYFRQWPEAYLIEAGLPKDWLKKCGLINADGDIPSQCSQRQFAAIVSKRFGKPVNQAAVSRAIVDGLNIAVTPSNGRLKTDAALRWWETNRAGVGGSVIATEAEDKAARQRIAREREEMELAQTKRREQFQKGETISVAVVKGYIAGIGAKIAGFYDRLIEDKDGLRADVQSAGIKLGISAETLHLLDGELAKRFVTANDGIKAEFRMAEADARKRIEELQREQVRAELAGKN